MRRIRPILPYALIMICCFYALPPLLRDRIEESVLLLAVLPGLCFLYAVVYGWRHRISWVYPCTTALLFVPAVFLFFDWGALIYVAAYAVIALAGCLTGSFLSGTKA